MFKVTIELIAYLLRFYLHILLMGTQIHRLHQILSKQAIPSHDHTPWRVETRPHAPAVE